MATRQLLAELVQAHAERTGVVARFESVGGVDAAKRVAAREPFDVVVLASDAIDRLCAGASVVDGSRVDLVRSGVSIAVRAGAARPDIGSEAALREAVLAAPRVGYSTGPSGVALLKLFERWGIAAALAGRAVQAPPGVPVGSMVASGEVALGFQQLSELMHLEGIDVIGPMPDAVRIDTVFSAGLCAAAQQPEAARALIDFLASPAAHEAILRQGMQPA